MGIVKVYLSPEEHLALRLAAAGSGTSMREWATEVVLGALPGHDEDEHDVHLRERAAFVEATGLAERHAEEKPVVPVTSALRAETDRIVAAARAKKAEGCDHKWVNGASGMTVCSKCGVKK